MRKIYLGSYTLTIKVEEKEKLGSVYLYAFCEKNSKNIMFIAEERALINNKEFYNKPFQVYLERKLSKGEEDAIISLDKIKAQPIPEVLSYLKTSLMESYSYERK